jgi:polysaccharide biosynthesis protein PslG
MVRLRRFSLLLTLAALLAGTIATTPAEAAKRKVPFGFFGTVVPPELTSPNAVSVQTLDDQFALMSRSGVESVRLTFAWEQLEPSKGTFDFANFDKLIRAASSHHLRIVANITQTPLWASSKPNGEFWRAPPKNNADFAELMSRLVGRYGPNGSFWTENPTLEKAPIRKWQIWNEENAPWHWSTKRWAPGYVKLLKAAYQAIKAGDRGATVVAGSFVAAPGYSQWAGVRDLYKAGGKRWTDEIAVHPFTSAKTPKATVDQMIAIVTLVRKAMRKAHAGRTPIIITELTWPASVGKIPKRALLGLETTTKGQTARMKAGYKRLVKMRRKLRVTETYWYTWASQYDRNGAESVMSFRYAGLVRVRRGVFSRLPILGTYTSLARKYEGCRKSDDARHCA